MAKPTKRDETVDTWEKAFTAHPSEIEALKDTELASPQPRHRGRVARAIGSPSAFENAGVMPRLFATSKS